MVVTVTVAMLGSLLILSPFVSDSSAQAFAPLDCDGTPYIMQNSRMYEVLPNPDVPGEFIFNQVGQSGITYGNSLAYDPLNNVLLATRKISNVWEVQTYDATFGVVRSLPIFSAAGSPEWPQGSTNYAGTALGDGRYLVTTFARNGSGTINGNNTNLWSIDPATGEATFIASVVPLSPRLADFSYNPADGYLYHAQGGNLIRINPLTGAKTNMGAVGGAMPSGSFGSSYFDAAGNLYVHKNNTGELTQISGIGTGTYTATLVATTPTVRGADAASCVGEIDLLKDVVDDAGDPVLPADRVYAPGDIVRYEFTIINNALPAGPQGLTLCDVLPADGRTYTGVFSSATSVSFSPPLAAGDTSFCASVTAPSSLWVDPSQPGGDPVTVTIEVQLGDDMLPGEYENQATLENPFQPGRIVNSDDPGDLSDPEDATTIEVTGEFTITKTVANHPDGNDTDTFTIVLACTDAEGVPFDVAPESIVDRDGLAWPGAAINSLPITDGGDVRVIDLPAGSTCTAIESPVPAAYALTTASSDELVDDGGSIVIDEAPSEERVDLTNRTGTFSFAKFTEPPLNRPAAELDLTGSFTIDVTCTGPDGTTVLPVTSYTVDASTIAGAGATGSTAYPDTPLLPDGSVCVATEQAATGWTDLTGETKFEITADEKTEVAFTNRRQLAELDVTKTITGLEPVDNPDDFAFEISIECSGGFSEPTVRFGPFPLETDLAANLSGLPVGTSCVVVEAPTIPFAPAYSPAGGLITIADGDNRVGIENIAGTFVIEKNTVVPSAPYPIIETDDFDFDVVCTDGDDVLTDATYTVAVTDTAPAAGATGGITYEVLPLLPPGTNCTITEVVPAGWVVTSAPSVDITIPFDGERPTASFTNERILGDLTITKTVNGLPAAIDPATLDFDITVQCKGPFTENPLELVGTVSPTADLVFPALPAGTACRVVEAADPRFVTEESSIDASIDSTDGDSVEFINTTSTLTVVKNTVTPGALPIEPDANFSVALTCTRDAIEVASMTLDLSTTDGSATVAAPDTPLLAPGTECELTETVPADWVVTTNPQTITLDTDPATVTFENTRRVGRLEITKSIAGLPAGLDPASYTFTVDVSCTGDFDTADRTWSVDDLTLSTTTNASIENLPTGAVCTIVEDAAPGFVASYPDGATATIIEGTATLSVLNTTSGFEIDKTTVVPAGVQDDDDFAFSWTCDNAGATTGSATLTTTGGAGTLAAVDGLPIVEPGTTCAITETPSAEWVVDQAVREVTTSSDAPVVASFVNTRVVEELTIDKAIVGLPGGDPTAFTFLVDVTCTGDFEPGPFTQSGLELKVGTPITIPDLPTGADCTVTEQEDPAWTPIYDPTGGDITITGGEANRVEIINSTGTLIVFKEATVAQTHPIDPVADFDFQIVCRTAAGVENANVVSSLTTDAITATGAAGGITYDSLGLLLEPGSTCDITELGPAAGWTRVSDETVTLTITADGAPTAVFTNERDLGTLQITKIVDGLPAALTPADFDFLVTATCNGGGLPADYKVGPIVVSGGSSVSIDDLPSGATCSVEETADNRFTPTYSAADVAIAKDVTAELSITNTTRTLEITKSASADSAQPIPLEVAFTFDVSCSNGFDETVTITTDATGSGSIAHPDLPLIADGTTCAVTEVNVPTGWTITSDPTQSAVLTQNRTLAFTNERATADLRVEKTITGLPADLDPVEYGFTVDVSCTGDLVGGSLDFTGLAIATNSPIVIDDLPTGTECTIAENPAAGFATTYPDGTTAVLSSDATLGIDNATSTFEITKTTTAPIGVVADATFTFDWSCTDAAASTGSASITTNAGTGSWTHNDNLPLLEPGTECTITETEIPEGWSVTPSATLSITTASDAIASAEFTNTRDTGTLTITKEIVGLETPDPALDDEPFTVTVTCAGDFDTSPLVVVQTVTVNAPIEIADLPTGAACGIEEAPDSRFTPVYDVANLTIAEGANDARIINATGRFIVMKQALTTSERPIDLVADFEFSITCTGTDGAIVFDEVRTLTTDIVTDDGTTGGIGYDTLPLLADGTTCSIEELPLEGWTIQTDPNPTTVTIDAATPATASFVNERDLGSIEVDKVVAGLPDTLDPADFDFLITATCNGGGLPTAYEVGPIVLKGDGVVTIDALPTGAVCSIVETADSRFTPTYSEDELTITKDSAAPLTITNTTRTLEITKTATTTSLLPIALSQDFTFDVDCTNGYSTTIVITTNASGIGRVGHPDLPLLADGTTCTVEETDLPAGWVVTSDALQSAELTADGTLPFTNERAIADLNVTKTVDGLPADLDPTDFAFTVDVVCTGDFAGGSHAISDIALSTDSPIAIQGIPTGASCTIAEDTAAGFTTSYPDTATALVGDAGATLAITNTTSTFDITKTTNAPAGVIADATFTFEWTCDNPGADSGSTTLTTSGGSASFDHNDGLPLLEPGTTCTVAETTIPTGWTATESTIELTTTADGIVTAAFVNTRDIGSLAITKSILGEPADPDPDLDNEPFAITITCTGDFDTSPLVIDTTVTVATQRVVDDLPTGAECSVEEAIDPRFTPTYSPGSITIATGANDLGIVNATGELIVSKETIASTTHPIDATGTFQFQITCTSPTGAVTFDDVRSVDASMLTATGAMGGIRYDQLPLLAAGTSCTIAELDPGSEWRNLTPDPITLEIGSDGPRTAAFVNERTTGSVELAKAIVGLPEGVDATDFAFSVTLTCNHDDLPTDHQVVATIGTDAPATIDDLPTGAVCTAEEAADDRFDATYSGAVTVGSERQTITVTNTTRTLTVTKTASTASTLPVDLVAVFDFDIVCSNGYESTIAITTDTDGNGTLGYPSIPLLPNGAACTVTEQTPPEGWTIAGDASQSVVLGSDRTAAFTNTRDVATVSVTKAIDGLPSGIDPTEFDFVVDITCDGDFVDGTYTLDDAPLAVGSAAVLAGVPTNADCSIVEAPSNQFLASYPDGTSTTVTDDGASLEIVNATSTFAIAKATVAPAGVIADGTFSFDWACTDPALSTGTAEITTTDGAGTWTHEDGLPLLPPGSVCTVTETDLPTGWTVASSPIEITTTPDGIVSAAFTNTRDLGSLTVAKSIVGEDPDADLDDEPFTVTVTCVGDFVASPQVSTLVITENAPATITDLPTGAECSIVEAADVRFTPAYDPQSLIVTAGANDATVVNNTGRFVVMKESIIGSEQPIDARASFEFRITCAGTDGVVVFDEVLVLDADLLTAQGAIGGIGYEALPLLADGSTCEIEELPLAGWTIVTEPNPTTIAIDSNDPATASFTNRRDLGDLTVTKTIAGLPVDLDPTDFVFEVTVACSGSDLPAGYQVGPFDIAVNEPVVIEGLPTAATCTVSETPDDRFTPTLPAPVTITTGENTAEVLNTTSTLAITKTAIADDPTIDLVDDFTFAVACDDGSTASVTITTAADGTGSATHLDGLPLVEPGTTCEITEAAALGWTVVGDNPSTVTTSADSIASADVTNRRGTTSLQITKQVAGRPVGHPGGETWTVDVACTGDFVGGVRLFADLAISEGGTISLTNLPTGATCVVTEDPSAGFTATTVPVDGTVTLGDTAATVVITNTTSTFEITKTTVAPAGVIDDATFEFTWSCDDVAASTGSASITTVDGTGSWTWADGLPLLEPGTTCDIDESSLPTGWTAAETSIEITTDAGAIATAGFVNTRTTAALEISKTILGLLPAEDPTSFGFTVDITCTGDFDTSPLVLLDQPLSTDGWITVPDLPTGATCTVVEDPTIEFAPLYGPADGEVTIDDNGAAVAITNLTGRVSLVKQTVVDSPHSVDPTATFRFDVRCIGLDGVTVTFADIVEVPVTTLTAAGAIGDATDFPPLAEGTNCVITELNDDDAPGSPTGWSLTSANGQNLTISSVPGEAVAFENTRDVADLTIAKTVTGLPDALDADDFVFQVIVECVHPDLPADHRVGPLSISSAAPIGVPKLPTGAVCTVTESPDDRFTPTYSAETVTITTGGASLVITNATAASTVTKLTSVDSGLDVDLVGTFEITMTCANGVNGSVTLTTDADGRATATTPALPLVAAGTECTFAETAPPAEWTTLTTPITTTMTIDGVDLTFNNERRTADLTVLKSIEGVDDGSFDATPFPITIECRGDFGASPVTIEGAISVNDPFVLEDIPTGAECTVIETADPRFTTTSAPTDGTVVVDDDGASVGFTNSTGRLIVAKTTVAADDQPIDPTGSFVFNFDCVSPAGEQTTFDRIADVTTLVGDGAAGGIPYTELPLLPDGTECTITELDAGPNWQPQTPTAVSVTLDADNPTTASFENLRRSALLRIDKEIAGLPTGQDDAFADVAFEVTVTCEGDFSTDDRTHTIVTTVSTSTPIEIPNLPTGAVCEIVETEDPRFVASYSPATVAIGPGGALAVITNRTGELIVAKEARVDSSHPITLDQTFMFQLRCIDPNGAVVFAGDRTVRTDVVGDGSATGGIRYEDLPLLPDGTVCTITEPAGLQPEGWVTTSAPSVEVTIDSDEPATASFVNERLVTDLVVNKTIVGLPGALDPADFSFTFNATCNHADLPSDHEVGPFTIVGEDTHRIEHLPVGATCAVTEVPDARFSSAIDVDTVVLEADVDATVTVTNTTSHFSITKTVTAPITHPIDRSATFDFTVVCSDGTTYETSLTTDANGAGSLSHLDGLPLLPPGVTCEVTELAADDHVVTSPETGTTTVEAGAGDRGPAAFVNERITGALRVTKDIIGLPDDADPTDYDFLVTVTCSGGFLDDADVVVPGRIATDTDLVIDDLPTGTSCVVVEDDDPRFVSSIAPASAVTVTADEVSVAVTNRTASFAIAKTTVVPGDSGLIADGTFEFTWSCLRGGASVGTGTVTLTTIDGEASTAWPELPLLPPGSSCFVSEDPQELFDIEAEKNAILDDEVQTFAFENTRLVADLTIDKTIVGLPEGIDPTTYDFTVDVTCAGNHTPPIMTFEDLALATDAPITIPDLPVGSVCTVIEDFDVRFAASYSPQGPTEDRGTATIVEDGTTLSVVNATGRVMLVKTASAPEGVTNLDTEASFDFAIRCVGTDGTVVFDRIISVTTDTAIGNGSVGALLWEDLDVVLAAGSTCTGEEVNVPDGWTAIDPSPQSVTVTRDEVVRLTFDNVVDVAPVNVGIQIDGLPEDLDPSQIVVTVEVTCDGPGLLEPITITIESPIGEPLAVPGMPVGTTCTVTTAGTPLGLFDPFSDVSVLTDGDEPADVTLFAEVATLGIEKTATLLDGTTGSLAATFEFELACGDAEPVMVSLTTGEDGTGSLGWPELPLVAAGSVCTITEAVTDGWIVQGDAAQTITLDVGENAPLAWTNEFQLGEPIPEPEPEPTPDPTPVPTTEPTAPRSPLPNYPPLPGGFNTPPSPAPTPATPAPAPPGALAYTGSETGRFVLIGVLLMVGGWTMLLGARRRERDEDAVQDEA